MWLEQTIWLWALLAGAATLWMTSRQIVLGHEVRRLHKRITQLEQASITNCVDSEHRTRSAA